MNQGVVVNTHEGTTLVVMHLIPASHQEPIINQGR